MTFSIAARDPQTGAFGLAVTTSGIAAGARCLYARAGVGAVLSQHRTDPRLGPEGLDLLASGRSAQQSLDTLMADKPDARWRQVAMVDARGRTATFHGGEIYSLHGHAAADGVIAIGNILKSETVPHAMRDAYLSSAAPMEERLLAGLAAGEAAGGELQPLQSAALLIVRDQSFPWMDLRVDAAAEPIAALSHLVEAYAPRADDVERRAVDPDSVPNDPALLALHAGLTHSAT